jgi:hypothetical protein
LGFSRGVKKSSNAIFSDFTNLLFRSDFNLSIFEDRIYKKRRELDVCFADMTLPGVETPGNEREAPEYSGEMMMGFVFLGSQLNLINKLDLLSKRFYGWLYSEERDTAKKIEKK